MNAKDGRRPQASTSVGSKQRSGPVSARSIFFFFFFESAFRIPIDREVQKKYAAEAVYRNNCTRSKTRVQSLSERVDKRVLTGPTVGSEVCTSSQARSRGERVPMRNAEKEQRE
jgi:hypothetical protein